jgi:hypothetical protein
VSIDLPLGAIIEKLTVGHVRNVVITGKIARRLKISDGGGSLTTSFAWCSQVLS